MEQIGTWKVHRRWKSIQREWYFQRRHRYPVSASAPQVGLEAADRSQEQIEGSRRLYCWILVVTDFHAQVSLLMSS